MVDFFFQNLEFKSLHKVKVVLKVILLSRNEGECTHALLRYGAKIEKWIWAGLDWRHWTNLCFTNMERIPLQRLFNNFTILNLSMRVFFLPGLREGRLQSWYTTVLFLVTRSLADLGFKLLHCGALPSLSFQYALVLRYLFRYKLLSYFGLVFRSSAVLCRCFYLIFGFNFELHALSFTG